MALFGSDTFETTHKSKINLKLNQLESYHKKFSMNKVKRTFFYDILPGDF